LKVMRQEYYINQQKTVSTHFYNLSGITQQWLRIPFLDGWLSEYWCS